MANLINRLKTFGNDGMGMPVNRLIILSDIIFGLAMTMLAFALEIPEFDSTEAEFIAVMKEDFQIFLIFLITFILLVIYWLGNVKRFSYIIKTNSTHLFIELMGLFFILVLPFTNGLISVHPDFRVVVLIYGIDLILIGLFAYWGWSYACHNHQLIKEDVSEKEIKAIGKELLIEPFVVFISILVGMIEPKYFTYGMLLIPLIRGLIIKLRSKKKSIPSQVQ